MAPDERTGHTVYSLLVMHVKHGSVVLFSALALLAATVSVAAETPQYFSIEMNSNLIGYAVVSSEKIIQDGRALVRQQSETALKVALLGTERNTLLESETLVDAETNRPIRYRMTDTTNSVIRHVEAEFGEATARVWTYREGDPRGEPAETKLAVDVVLLGSNNFGHWQRLLDAAIERFADGETTLTVFLPDTSQLDTFKLVRGEAKEVFLAGGVRECVSWHLEKANLSVLADARTNEFLRLELPGQQTTIELSSENVVKLAQKSTAEEILTRHFAQSNVLFDDFLSVSELKAIIDVNVIGSGIANDLTALNTEMQLFEGVKEADRIVGTVVIRRVDYDAEQSPPVASPPDELQLDEWLKPSAFIESDDPSIAAKSLELTKDVETRWEAVQTIGKWVYEEISYTIADTPSARLAFERKTGDCGPHATLMVAMLRAQGIPSRLVGGLVYTPTFGGSFGQHAWVEVYTGDKRWRAVDPTTGEFQQLSATHIKLFEGLGGVVPKQVEVVAFEPPNREAQSPTLSQARPLTWKLGKEYTFRYSQGDKELGNEIVTITKIRRNDEDAYQLNSSLNLTIDPATSLTSSATIVVAANALPHSFERNLVARQQNVKIECSFKDGVVAEKISGTTNLSHEIKVPVGAYCFDNNLMGCFVLICSQLTLQADQPLTIQTFHPSTMQIIPLTFTPKAATRIEIGGMQIPCFECEVAPINNTFWVSQDGRFVRARQGDLVIELSEVD